jgi:hypothetical protein
VHFAIHLNVFHHIAALCLETAIEIVKILDAANLADSGVE